MRPGEVSVQSESAGSKSASAPPPPAASPRSSTTPARPPTRAPAHVASSRPRRRPRRAPASAPSSARRAPRASTTSASSARRAARSRSPRSTTTTAAASMRSPRSPRVATRLAASSTGGGAVTISIRDANGDPLEAVHVGDRTFVVGQAGQRYSIVLAEPHQPPLRGGRHRRRPRRHQRQAGHVRQPRLRPPARSRRSRSKASAPAPAPSRPSASPSVADSYAAQTGSARNVGVIGIAFFGERGDSFVPESETRLRDTASPFPADPRFAQPPRAAESARSALVDSASSTSSRAASFTRGPSKRFRTTAK